MSEDRTPILIGAGQLTQRDVDPGEAKDPLALMVETAQRAAADAGANARLLTRLDYVAVANILSWHYASPPGLLAERLGAHPSRALYTTIGGNTPQSLVNAIAAEIAAGRAHLVLLAGAEAVYTLLRARRAHTELRWTTAGTDAGPPPTIIGDHRPGSNDHEVAHGLQMPTAIYPLFENALRVHYGLGLAAHREQLGVLCSRLSAVAAQNPHAWFPVARRADEIATVTPVNRMIGFPYPKYMNAIMDVDQSAALLMTSVAGARELGIHPSRWVYLWGGTDARDLWWVSDRINYHSSPAIRIAGQRALAMAGIGIDQIDFLDLYSCFPSAVQVGRDMLGIALDDPRPLSVTGGLPYHGGPGNNYVMHAIATMMQQLRAAPGTKGLVTGIGWYLTKHSVGVYSAAPPDRVTDWSGAHEDAARFQAELDAAPHPVLASQPQGRGSIETYTVLHDRDGTPVTGIVIGRLGDGRRFLANTPDDRSVLEGLMDHEAVGDSGRASAEAGVNRFDPGA